MIPTLARAGERLVAAINWRTFAVVFVLAALGYAALVWREVGQDSARRACLLAGGVYAAGDCWSGRMPRDMWR